MVVSKEQITKLSAELGSNWKMLATELNFPEDDITYVESETSDVDAQGLKMLTIWMVSALKYSLQVPIFILNLKWHCKSEYCCN